MVKNSTNALSPNINVQVFGAGVPPSPIASPDMIVQSYAYYAPTATGCTGGLATPQPSPSPAPLASAMLADGAVLLWPQQEFVQGVSTAKDLSSEGNNGTVGSNVTVNSSAIQSFPNISYLFPSVASGSGTLSSVGFYNGTSGPAGFSPTTAFTALTWFNFSSVTHSAETLMVYGNLLYGGGPAFTMTFQTSGSGVLTATLQAGSGPTTYTLTSPSALSANTEHMAAITYNGSTFALWIDPTSTSPTTSVPASGNVYLANAASGFWVGDDGNGEAASFYGNDNYSALFPTALSGSALDALYAYH
jgi:hypothetical protein